MKFPVAMIAKIWLMSYRPVLLLLLFYPLAPALSQQLDTSKYGVATVKDPAWYLRSVKADPNKQMVELKQLMPGLVYELHYASTDNFTHQALYPAGTRHTFLRRPAATALAAVAAELKKENLGLKIFDAYRPYRVTMQFWELIHDDRYVADPSKGSGHNRGLAIDLTLIDLTSGKELDMGTGFDNFSDTAHHTFTRLPETVLNNRKKFCSIMERQGFRAFETEWWHYAWPNDREYEVLDLTFRQLRGLTGKRKQRQ